MKEKGSSLLLEFVSHMPFHCLDTGFCCMYMLALFLKIIKRQKGQMLGYLID